jgi:hypothetical protein
MRFERRQLLRILSFAFGSGFIVSWNQLGMAVQTGIQPKLSAACRGGGYAWARSWRGWSNKGDVADGSFQALDSAQEVGCYVKLVMGFAVLSFVALVGYIQSVMESASTASSLPV